MKSKIQIQQEIALIKAEGQMLLINYRNGKMDEDKYNREHSKLEKEYLFLKDCVAYLESEPSEEFLIKERDRLDKILKMIPLGYPQWKKNTPDSVYGGDNSKALPCYNKMMQKSKHTRHLKNINYLLEGKLQTA